MATHFSILAWRIPMDRGAWLATVCGAAKSQKKTERLSTAPSTAQQVALGIKNPPANAGDIGDTGSNPGNTPWRRKWQPTPVFFPGESHGQRSLVGYSPQGHKESDTSEDDLTGTLSILGASKLLNAWNTSSTINRNLEHIMISRHD